MTLCHASAAAGVVDCAKKTIQWEGLGGLYKVRRACLCWIHICTLLQRQVMFVGQCFDHMLLMTVDSMQMLPKQTPTAAKCLTKMRAHCGQGVASPLAGQMVFRASLFATFGGSKRWLGTNADGTPKPLSTADFYKAGAITGFVAAFSEGPIDFYKSQIQVQIIRSKTDPNYTRELLQQELHAAPWQ